MKRIFLLTASMLVWGGPVVAAELKVMVPVNEFKQLQSRLEALEKENAQLKQVEGAAVASPVSGELQSRLQSVENENNRLRQELNAVKGQERPAQVSPEVQARLEAVESENRQLRESMQARDVEKSSGGEDAGLSAKLNAAENENIKLQQEVKLLKDGGFAALFSEDKISARELYFQKRKKGISHAYKF